MTNSKKTFQADSILFDLDGTLWDSIDGILVTWNRVISKYPGLRPPIDRAEQKSLMGLQMNEIAERLFPSASSSCQKALMDECIEAENQYLSIRGGVLYPNVESTLTQLRKNHGTYIVSNCQSGYIEAFLKAHKLESLFDGFLCYGDTGNGKGQNIQAVIQRYELCAPVYVGDTQGDQTSAAFAGIPFIYASYGFGSVTRWDAKIQDFSDLLSILTPESRHGA